RMTEAKEPKEKVTAFTQKFDLFARIIMSGDASQLQMSFDPKDPNDVLMEWLAKHPAYTAPMFINDPLQTIQAVTIPVLVLQGEKDLHVAVKDANYISEALMRLNHKDTTYKLLPDVNHLLKDHKAPATAILSTDVKQPLSADLLAALNEWLAKRK
ncbi:MAG: hypothetical protein HOP19_14600, partial [Acidobacteria bacterium]|nr:hypothetical protein [Acidobacteriota bacterium]